MAEREPTDIDVSALPLSNADYRVVTNPGASHGRSENCEADDTQASASVPSSRPLPHECSTLPGRLVPKPEHAISLDRSRSSAACLLDGEVPKEIDAKLMPRIAALSLDARKKTPDYRGLSFR
jgi:hypothetical protein